MDFKPLITITITINNNYATDRACQQSLVEIRESSRAPPSAGERVSDPAARHILHVDVVACLVGDKQALAWGDTHGGAQDHLSPLSLCNKSQESERTERESRTHPPPTPEMYVNDVPLYFCIRRCDVLNTC
jgi:hypothetical protein